MAYLTEEQVAEILGTDTEYVREFVPRRPGGYTAEDVNAYIQDHIDYETIARVLDQ